MQLKWTYETYENKVDHTFIKYLKAIVWWMAVNISLTNIFWILHLFEISHQSSQVVLGATGMNELMSETTIKSIRYSMIGPRVLSVRHKNTSMRYHDL